MRESRPKVHVGSTLAYGLRLKGLRSWGAGLPSLRERRSVVVGYRSKEKSMHEQKEHRLGSVLEEAVLVVGDVEMAVTVADAVLDEGRARCWGRDIEIGDILGW